MSKVKWAIPALLLIVFLLFALWVGSETRAARRATEEYFQTLAQGNLPANAEGSLLKLAENLLEFSMPGATVGRVRLTSLHGALAKVNLNGARGGDFTFTLQRRGGRWLPLAGDSSSLAVVAGDPPLLVLTVGESTLEKALQPLGFDKILTLHTSSLEGFNQGWRDLAPYFTTFYRDQPAGLIVGMTDVVLYSHGERLAAAVRTKPYVPRFIRVNLSTTGHGGIYHDRVKLSSRQSWQVTEAVTGREISLAPGAVELIAGEQGIFLGAEQFSHRLIFVPDDSGGQLEFSSITRTGGAPSYYGALEVANFGGQLVVVNEVPLEQYLYYVLPGEMPTSFGPRALEVQAIVARTYALSNLYASGWRRTSAHVVDSVLSQVYNNGGANSTAIAAVEATRGQYLEVNGSPADVRFFSTSSGFTANAHQVWAGSDGFPGAVIPWLVARPQYSQGPEQLEGEEAYSSFVHNPPAEAYDAPSPWFRWQVQVSGGQLEEMIRENLIKVFAANPAAVFRETDTGFLPAQEMPQDPLGELLDLVPAQRGGGGILMAVDIVGSHGTWRVEREYYIRQVLRPQIASGQPIELVLNDGSGRGNFSLLPSAFVIWELERENQQLISASFYGGGFGHGVGMSQYGVRELTRRGWSRNQILEHYFPGTSIALVGE